MITKKHIFASKKLKVFSCGELCLQTRIGPLRWRLSPQTPNSDTFEGQSMNSSFENLQSAPSAKTNRQKLLYFAISSTSQNPVSLEYILWVCSIPHEPRLCYKLFGVDTTQLGIRGPLRQARFPHPRLKPQVEPLAALYFE